MTAITMEELKKIGDVRKRHVEVYKVRGHNLQIREDVQTLLLHVDALIQNTQPDKKKATRG